MRMKRISYLCEGMSDGWLVSGAARVSRLSGLHFNGRKMTRCIQKFRESPTQGGSGFPVFVPRRQTGFTLLELLVTIAIISILGGLLLPALAGGKARAQLAICTSNLRQFAIAVHLYSEDHSDWLPPNQDGQNGPAGSAWVQGWLAGSGPDRTNTLILGQSLVAPYLRATAVWRCPAVRTAPVRTLSMNSFVGAPWKSLDSHTYLKLSEVVVPSPSEVFLFVDELADTVNDGSFAIQRDFRPDSPGSWMLRDKPSSAHRGAASVSFVDGHAESRRWVDPRTKSPPRDDAIMPENMDVLWLYTHATAAKGDRL